MKKKLILQFVYVGTPEKSAQIIRNIVKRQIEKVLAKHGAVSSNLNEVLEKYIPGK